MLNLLDGGSLHQVKVKAHMMQIIQSFYPEKASATGIRTMMSTTILKTHHIRPLAPSPSTTYELIKGSLILITKLPINTIMLMEIPVVIMIHTTDTHLLLTKTIAASEKVTIQDPIPVILNTDHAHHYVNMNVLGEVDLVRLCMVAHGTIDRAHNPQGIKEIVIMRIKINDLIMTLIIPILVTSL